MRLLIDLRTGEPTLDQKGDFQQISVERALYQYLDVLFHTDILTEALLPHWGIDRRGIVVASANQSWEQMIKYSLIQSLSPSMEPLIAAIDSIDLTRDDRSLYAEISITSRYGTTINNVVKLLE
jgi:hypothetical protein